MKTVIRNSAPWVAIVVGAAVLRLWMLGASSLWYDEAMYGLLAKAFAPGLLRASYILIEPLFVWPLSLWLQLGESAFWFRLPSAIAGVLAVVVAMRLAHGAGGRRAALVVGLLAACAPAMLYYSRDGKMYGWQIFWVLLAASQAVGILRAPSRWKGYAGYGIAALALCYTHFTAPLFLGVSGALVFVGLLPRWRAMLAWCALNAVVVVGALPFIWMEQRYGETMRGLVFHATRPEPQDLLITFEHFFTAYVVARPISIAAVAAGGALALLGLLRGAGPWRARVYLFVLGTAPAGILYAISIKMPWSVYIDRYVIGCAGPLIVLAGLGIARMPWPVLRGLALGMLLALFAAAWPEIYTHRTPEDHARRKGLIPHLEMDAMAAAIAAHAQPGDVIYHAFWETQAVFHWHLPQYRQGLVEMNGELQQNLDMLTRREYQALFDWHPVPLRSLMKPGSRLWLVVPASGALRGAYAGMEETLGGQGECLYSGTFGEGDARTALSLYVIGNGADAQRDRRAARLDIGGGSVELAAATSAEACTLSVKNGTAQAVNLPVEAVFGEAAIPGNGLRPQQGENSAWKNSMYLALGTTGRATQYRVDPKKPVRDALQGEIALEAGDYVAYVYRTVRGTKYRIPAARITVTLGATALASDGTFADRPGGWEWQRLGAFSHAGEALAVGVEASDPERQPEAYAVFSQVVIVRAGAAEGLSPTPPMEQRVVACAAGGAVEEQFVAGARGRVVALSGALGAEAFVITARLGM